MFPFSVARYQLLRDQNLVRIWQKVLKVWVYHNQNNSAVVSRCSRGFVRTVFIGSTHLRGKLETESSNVTFCVRSTKFAVNQYDLNGGFIYGPFLSQATRFSSEQYCP